MRTATMLCVSRMLALTLLLDCVSRASGQAALFSDQYYEWNPTKLTADQADAEALSRGGYLVCIESYNEEQYMLAVLVGFSNEFAWIGANDKAVEGDWRWVSDGTNELFFRGTRVGSANSERIGGRYENWHNGEPNNYDVGTNQQGFKGYEHCAVMAWNANEWNDYPCNGYEGNGRYSYGSIVEYDNAVNLRELSYDYVSHTAVYGDEGDVDTFKHRYRIEITDAHVGELALFELVLEPFGTEFATASIICREGNMITGDEGTPPRSISTSTASSVLQLTWEATAGLFWCTCEGTMATPTNFELRSGGSFTVSSYPLGVVINPPLSALGPNSLFQFAIDITDVQDVSDLVLMMKISRSVVLKYHRLQITKKSGTAAGPVGLRELVLLDAWGQPMTVVASHRGSWHVDHFSKLFNGNSDDRAYDEIAFKSSSGSDPNQASQISEFLFQARRVWAMYAYINFQPGTATAPSGYLGDSGMPFASRGGLTYGWSCDMANTCVDRNTGDDLLDTWCYTPQEPQCPDGETHSWNLGVPNGDYDVVVGYGDKSGSVETSGCTVEGISASVGTVPAIGNSAMEWSGTVSVSDGKLTLGGRAPTCGSFNYVRITQDLPQALSWCTTATSGLDEVCESTATSCRGVVSSGASCDTWCQERGFVCSNAFESTASCAGQGAAKFCNVPAATHQCECALTDDIYQIGTYQMKTVGGAEDPKSWTLSGTADAAGDPAAAPTRAQSDTATWSAIHSKTDHTWSKEYIGCFRDDGNRDFPVAHGKQPFTIDTCAERCVDYAFMGIQNYGECFCGNDYSTPPTTYPQIADADCGQCPGQNCLGAGWSNAVYSLSADDSFTIGGGASTVTVWGQPSTLIAEDEVDLAPFHKSMTSTKDDISIASLSRTRYYFAVRSEVMFEATSILVPVQPLLWPSPVTVSPTLVAGDAMFVKFTAPYPVTSGWEATVSWTAGNAFNLNAAFSATGPPADDDPFSYSQVSMPGSVTNDLSSTDFYARFQLHEKHPFSNTITVSVAVDGPVLTDVGYQPGNHPTAGNFEISIRGFYFHPGTTVTVGGETCNSPDVLNSGILLTCYAPVGEGYSDVSIFSLSGDLIDATQLRYDAPIITKVVFTDVPTQGGGANTALLITGFNFGSFSDPNWITVTVGGIEFAVDTAASAHTLINVYVPEGQGYDLPVVVTNTQGDVASIASTFSYALPSVSEISPFEGDTRGNFMIEVLGANFGKTLNARTRVVVGGQLCGNLVMEIAHFKLSCTVPAGNYGQLAQVVVYVEDRPSISQIAFQYALPRFDSVVSSTGLFPTVGGAAHTLTISGDNFGKTAADLLLIYPGEAGIAIAANDLLWWDHDAIELPLPAGMGGARITLGLASVVLNYDPPVVTSVVTLADPVATTRGAKIQLGGSNFGPLFLGSRRRLLAIPSPAEASATVGGSTCTVEDPNNYGGQLVCTLGEGVGMNLPVILTIAGRSSAPVFDFTYPKPRIDAISRNGNAPCTPPANTWVDISGANFGVDYLDNGGSVVFNPGTTECVVKTWTHEVISCYYPAGEGTMDVVVRIANQEDTASFTYGAPTITQPAILSGAFGTRGGIITIIGDNLGIRSNNIVVTATRAATPDKTCSGVVWFSSKKITCTLPAGSGTGYTLAVDVAGQSTTSIFNLDYPGPTVLSSTPDHGTTDGLSLQVRGTNFGTEAADIDVVIGGEVCVVSGPPTHDIVTCDLPAGYGTAKDAVVTVNSQRSPYPDPFIFDFDPPTISSVDCGATMVGNRAEGCAITGGTLTITGSNFGPDSVDDPNLSVHVGPDTCHPITVVGNTLSCTYPQRLSGGFDVNIVVVVDDQSTQARLFSYEGPKIIAGTLQTASTASTTDINGTCPAVTCGHDVVTSTSARGLQVSFSGSALGGAGWAVFYGPTGDERKYTCDNPTGDNDGLVCTLSDGAGEDLHFVVITQNNAVSAPGLDTLTYPQPELVNNGFGSPFDGTNLWTGSSSSGELISFEALHVGTVPQDIVVTYGADYTCQVLVATRATPDSSEITCEAAPGEGGPYDLTIAVNGRASVAGPLAFLYPAVPIIHQVQGCDDVGNQTENCPTEGLITLSISGEFTIANLDDVRIFVGARQQCSVLTGSLNLLTCILPAGVGVDVDLSVQTDKVVSVSLPWLSYKVPLLDLVTGCDPYCSRTGGDLITLTGTSFGQSDALVLVGGQPCASVTHIGTDDTELNRKITCLTPVGEGLVNILLVQDGGEVSNNTLSVTYEPCDPGFIRDANNYGKCAPCPAGTAAQQAGQAACIPCDEGYYAEGLNNTVCTPCPAGMSSDASLTGRGPASCSNCTAGYVTPFAGQSSCSPCDPGFHAPEEGLTTCTVCAIGTAASSPHSDTCSPCDPGYFAASPGMTDCLPCPSGSAVNDTGAFRCTACEPGSAALNEGNIVCKLCAIGRATNAKGQDQCAKCVPGTFANDTGLGGCFPCDAGTFQDGLSATASQCDACLEGSYQPAKGQSACLPCPAGHECPLGAVDKLVCRIGTAALSLSAVCASCPIGQHAPVSGMAACDQCDPGSRGVAGTPNTCVSCGPGSFQADVEQTQCDPCPEGHATPLDAQVICGLCQPGTFAPGGNTSCTPCPRGHDTSQGTAVGKAAAGTCEPCTAGRFAPLLGQAVCEPCEIGRFSTPGAEVCTPCTAGKSQQAEGQTTCTNCTAGKASSVSGSVICDVCPGGKYTSTQGMDECVACLPGTTTIESSATGCSPCDAGKYAPKSASTECIACEIGKYQNSTNMAVCSDCPPGQVQPVGASTGCVKCEVGFFMKFSGKARCEPCEAGRYSNTKGADECVKCAPGSFSLGGTFECTLCPSGKYQDSEGATDCKSPITGYYAPVEGLSEVTPCASGYVAEYEEVLGTVSCSRCDAGSYTAAPAQGPPCDQCDFGYYAASANATSCAPASSGYFVARRGAGAQTPCGQGTYQASQGQSLCLSCEAGTFTNDTGTANCDRCPPGTYQPDFGELGCIACDPGKFQFAFGATGCSLCEPGTFSNATAVTNCTACPAGYASPQAGSLSCDICPRGKYAPEYSSECLACPVKQVSFLEGAERCQVCPEFSITNELSTDCLCIVDRAGLLTAREESESTNLTGTTVVDYKLSCPACPEGAVCTQRGTMWETMATEPGFWEEEKDFYRCLLETHCLGGPTTRCGDNRIGPLCAKCKPQFSPAVDGSCAPCASGAANIIYMIVIVVVAACLLLLQYYIILNAGRSLIESSKREIEAKERQAVGYIVDYENEYAEELMRHHKFLSIYREPVAKPNFTFKLKIWLGFSQIVTNISGGLEVQWPASFKNFVAFWNIVNIDFFSGAQVSCVLGESNYFTKMWVVSSGPPVILLLLFLLYFLPRTHAIPTHDEKVAKEERRAVRQRFSRLAVFSLFLVYPFCSTTVCRLYICKEVRSISYLVQDFSIQCASPEWLAHAIPAGVVMVLYPLGIPLLFFLLVLNKRGRLSETGVRAELGLLYDGYERSVWYFEMADMAHKLCLTSLIAFLPYEYQMACGLLVATLYTMLILITKPYIRKGDDRLHLLAQTELLLILLSGRVFNSPRAPDVFMDNFVSILLIAGFLLFVGFFIVGSATALRKIIKEQQVKLKLKIFCANLCGRKEKVKHLGQALDDKLREMRQNPELKDHKTRVARKKEQEMKGSRRASKDEGKRGSTSKRASRSTSKRASRSTTSTLAGESHRTKSRDEARPLAPLEEEPDDDLLQQMEELDQLEQFDDEYDAHHVFNTDQQLEDGLPVYKPGWWPFKRWPFGNKYAGRELFDGIPTEFTFSEKNAFLLEEDDATFTIRRNPIHAMGGGLVGGAVYDELDVNEVNVMANPMAYNQLDKKVEIDKATMDVIGTFDGTVAKKLINDKATAKQQAEQEARELIELAAVRKEVRQRAESVQLVAADRERESLADSRRESGSRAEEDSDDSSDEEIVKRAI